MTRKLTKPLYPAHRDADWLAKWAPPCPDGKPQGVMEILGFRLKGADYLQLRVLVTRRDVGGCHLIVEEHPDRIYVRALTHLAQHGDSDRSSRRGADETDCPSNWWLDEPLGERVVIDVDSDEELPYLYLRSGSWEPWLYIPRPRGLLWPSELVDLDEPF